MNCLNCGKEIKTTFREQTTKFCSKECCQIFHRLKKYYKKYCKICGKELEKPKRDYCSPECVKQARDERRAKEREECKKPKAEVKEPKKRDRPKKKLTLAQINELARAEGLNYGQYCAKHKLY